MPPAGQAAHSAKQPRIMTCVIMKGSSKARLGRWQSFTTIALAPRSKHGILPGPHERCLSRSRYDGGDTIANGPGRDSQPPAWSIGLARRARTPPAAGGLRPPARKARGAPGRGFYCVAKAGSRILFSNSVHEAESPIPDDAAEEQTVPRRPARFLHVVGQGASDAIEMLESRNGFPPANTTWPLTL